MAFVAKSLCLFRLGREVRARKPYPRIDDSELHKLFFVRFASLRQKGISEDCSVRERSKIIVQVQDLETQVMCSICG